MYKYLFKILLLFSLALLYATPLLAQDIYTVESVPNPKDTDGGWVSDPNNYLNETNKLELNRIVTAIENKSTAQIAIVIVPSIGEEVPKSFAVDLFEHWGIGQPKKDNGLLILTVMDQRRTEFEVGYGLEPILTDALSYRIASQELVPHFKNGNYGLGLLAGVERIQQVLDNPEVISEIYDEGLQVEFPRRTNPIWFILFTYFGIFLFVAYHYFSKLKKINKNKDDFYDKFIDLYGIKHWIYMIIFPLPFLLIRWLFISSRLKRYRNHKRFSKINGQEMFKKSEEADNAFLKRGQIVEEELKSVDYDVWVTNNEEDVLVLSYKKPFTKYSTCPKCNYKTYHRAHSKVVRSATRASTGLRVEIYKCKNCDYSTTRNITIPKITSSSSSSGGSSYGGGSSFGGSSFGGGSSGGGGAGVSW